MGSKRKRKSLAPNEEQQQPTPKRASSQQGRRSIGGSGSSPLAWSANGVTVTLPSTQALLFLGRARLTVQSGEISVFGSTITAANGSIELCADERCGGSLLLEPGAALGAVPLAATGQVVFSLTRSMAAGGAAGAGPPATPPPPRRQKHEDAGEASSGGSGGRWQHDFEVYLSSDTNAPAAAAPLPLPPLWQQAADEVEESLEQQQQQQHQQQQGSSLPGAAPPSPPPPSVIVVCGAKKVGKSTFARFLLNSLLNKHATVAYMDTDCGQPEFTPPGLVSLSLLRQPVLGPPHMHQQPPAAAYFVGDTSPANDPVRYLQYVREMHSWYCQHAASGLGAAITAANGQDAAAEAAARKAGRAAAGSPGSAEQQQQQQPEVQQQQLPPLVINTHGWVKGMGFDVLVELLQSLPVSHLLQIGASNPKKNLPLGTFWLPGGGAGQQQQEAPPQQPRVLQWLLPGLGSDQHQQQQQPGMSETSARSGGATAAAAVSDIAGGRARLNAVEQRALQWEALAQQCIHNCGLAAPQAAGSRGGAAAAAAAAAVGQGADLGDRLAAAVPFEVELADVRVQVMHCSLPTSQMCYALNGAVVGLCTAAPQQTPAAAAAAAAAGSTTPPASPAALLCMGLGIVRAADAKQRCLHILTAVPETELERVTVLQLGRLELPAGLLQTAAHMSPYLCLFSLSSMGTGAGAIKSRNNLMRQSQL